MESEIHLKLGIWGFTDITRNEITNILNLDPEKIHVKGEKISPKFLPVAKENGWIYTHSKIVTRSFEDQMNELVLVLKQKGESLKILSKKCYLELSCAVFKKGEESMPWVHLTKEHIQFLNELV